MIQITSIFYSPPSNSLDQNYAFVDWDVEIIILPIWNDSADLIYPFYVVRIRMVR